MLITIHAIGRLKAGATHALSDAYLTKANQFAGRAGYTGVSVREYAESRARDTATRKREEGASILSATAAAGRSVNILLDETGKALTSRAFASRLEQWRDQQASAVHFLIGGPDGHGDDVRKHAAHTLSFGPATLPHGLARIVLLEQVYRGFTILAGHPYHRD
ncbi:MAG: 23S rRNA (pseudouridine(1915)-N(3))-methyltransferase RlmH [Pseudomonadota bacterium]